MSPGSHPGLSEAEIKAGDKKTRPPKDPLTGEVITGKVFPGGLSNKTYNEVINPDG
jgi:hypothetical protein